MRSQRYARGSRLILWTVLAALTWLASVIPQTADSAAEDERALIVKAYQYGFPAFEEARLAYAFSYDPRNPRRVAVNTFGHRRELADATARTVTTPNNDTLYSSAIIDLSEGPVRLDVPEFQGRYFSIAFLDAYTNDFAYLGTRMGGDAGGTYLLAGPHWHGNLEPEEKLIRAPGDHIIALLRILIDGPQDYEDVHRLQDRVMLSPRSPAAAIAHRPIAPVAHDPENFISVVNQVLRDNPPPRADEPLLQQLASVGIGAHAPPLSQQQRELWSRYFAAAEKELLATSKTIGTQIAGWDYPPSTIGEFGTDYRMRAVIALLGIGANVPSEMQYALASKDADGNALVGSHRYRLHLPAGAPPARGFWSISMYEANADGRLFFVANPINRYSIGDRTPGLVRNPDGSLEIVIQNDRPNSGSAPNWLPAPSGPFAIIARAYLPGDALLNGRFRYPAIERQD